MLKTLFIFGTRPEAIKLAPLIREFQQDPGFEVFLCNTGQHKEMLDQVLLFFELQPDFNLRLMQPNQTLFDVTVNGLKALEPVLDEVMPDIIFVQGDTTTAFVGALAGYYKRIRVGHIEAGLRSRNKYSPFPEEINRALIGQLADIHFVPTSQALKNLEKENVQKMVFQVGNSVIDALFLGLELNQRKEEELFFGRFRGVDFSKKIILVTGHRRESFGKPFENICLAIRDVALQFADEVQIVYPVHLNPNVQKVVQRNLADMTNVHLTEPLDYPYLIWLMNKSYLVLTDSGGIQEEAPSLGKPVLVMREVTERQEGIDAGTAKLVGTDRRLIVDTISELINSEDSFARMARAINPYGDGTASRQIHEIISKLLKK